MEMVKTSAQGNISVEGIPVGELVQTYGSPLYVYSERQIEKNVRQLKEAISSHFTHYHIEYALKANNNPHIVKVLRDQGLGADCSSPAEAKIAKLLDFPMERSTYTGNFESQEDFDIPLENAMTINLDDDQRLDLLLNRGKGTPPVLSFRINPGIGRGGFEGIVTGGNDAKFGIPYERCKQAYRMAQEKGFERFGIHMMTGSNILEPYYFAEITEKLLSIVEENLLPLGIELEFFNIGGGLGIPYTPEEKPLDIHKTFELVARAFHHKVKQWPIGNPSLVVEPGRYLVGNTGVILSEVTHIKKSYRSYLGLDSSMSTLLRPSLYKAFHSVLIDGRPHSSLGKPLWVCGQICENSDVHPQERLFDNPQPGDIAVIENTGAYGFTMSNHYNGRPRPAEVMITQQGPQLIRERESIDDLFQKVTPFLK